MQGTPPKMQFTLRDGPDPVDVAVGSRIRARRRGLGLSQTQLAVAVGITFQQIQKYERGANRVATSMLIRIAAKLETSVAALIGEDGAEPLGATVHAHLTTPGAVELLTVFAGIADGEARRAVLEVVKTMGAETGKRSTRR